MTFIKYNDLETNSKWTAWEQRRNFMFHYVDDKCYLKKAQSYCSELLTDLTLELLEKDISSQFFLVGSGARNMVTQNGNEPIDFDYNLYIQKCNDINNCQFIKETVRKAFNKVLRTYNLSDCDDSTSSLTTKPIYFKDKPKIQFSIDLCIVAQNDKRAWFRLIHEKTGYTSNDRYFWNEAPNSKNIKMKSSEIKDAGKWQFVRDEYIELKNAYLQKNDYNHPSFICYIESVNNIYNHLRQKKII